MHLFLLAVLSLAATTYAEDYRELLTFRQTRDGKLISTFNFTIDLPQEAFPTAEFASYTLFPSSLGEILRKDEVTEIHMTLNSGKWDYLKWGYEEGVGSGGEIWSWMAGDDDR
jgi:GPI-anchor transamidase subunit T